MSFDLSLQHFRFSLEPKGTLHLPAYNKGNVIRGGFGSTFRRLVCHPQCKIPESCELRHLCPYAVVFSPTVPEGSEKISRNRDIPRPFVIKPPLETRQDYPQGGCLSFEMVLVGKAQAYLPYFVVTFRELSTAGLGRTRTGCELVGLESLSPDGRVFSVYDAASRVVRPPQEAIRWSDIAGVPGTARSITLRFLTPTTLKVGGAVVRTPRFSDILKRLRDRISALSYFYCGQGLEMDFRAFGQEAEKIKTVRDCTRWVDLARYSRRRDVEHDLSGFIGEVSFEGEIVPFLPFLRLGAYLHVGKNAVFGNGWYEIVEVR